MWWYDILQTFSKHTNPIMYNSLTYSCVFSLNKRIFICSNNCIGFVCTKCNLIKKKKKLMLLNGVVVLQVHTEIMDLTEKFAV